MKKVIFLALALMASASFCPIEAVKKKNKVVVFPAEALRLNNGSDSVSYAAGMSLTNGLIPFLLQQKVDTALMADFVRGFREAVKSADDPKQHAYMIGTDIARQVKDRMVPGLSGEFKDSPDSIVPSLLYKGFVARQGRKGGYLLFFNIFDGCKEILGISFFVEELGALK